MFSITGQILAAESCFTYGSGESRDTYARDDEFTPTFADDIEITPDIQEACQDNPQCIYDYTLTGDSEVGMGTLMTTVNNEENEVLSSESVPTM